MEEEQYCLKWNNHQTTLLTVLTGLMDSEKLSDCVLAAEGKMVKAHQVIISACSPYLERLLNESRQPGLMPILVFSDIMFEELVAMKEYMYKGEVNIRQDALDSFLKAAGALQIKGLADGGGGGSEDSGGGGGKRKAAQDQGGAPPGRRRRRESRDSDNASADMHLDQQTTQPAPVKKQNVFTAKIEPFEAPPVVKMEPVMEPAQPQMPQPQIQHPGQLAMKPEPQDHHPEPETHDLTGLDDDEDYDYEMPGTSQPDLSQDISNWQMDNSMHSAEDFAASQSMNTSQPQQSSQEKWICNACLKSFTRKHDLKRHQKVVCGKSALPCHFCGVSFKQLRSLSNHINKFHRMESVTFCCTLCQFRSLDEMEFKAHLKVVHGQDIETSTGVLTSFKANLNLKKTCAIKKRNDANHDPSIQIFSCHICPYRSRSEASVEAHIKLKHFDHLNKPKVSNEVVEID